MGRLSGDGDVDEDDGGIDNVAQVMMMMLLLLMTTMMSLLMMMMVLMKQMIVCFLSNGVKIKMALGARNNLVQPNPCLLGR